MNEWLELGLNSSFLIPNVLFLCSVEFLNKISKLSSPKRMCAPEDHPRGWDLHTKGKDPLPGVPGTCPIFTHLEDGIQGTGSSALHCLLEVCILLWGAGDP
jgi:hypothetical protein